MKSALVLCSGGLDSVVCAYYVRKKLHYDDLTLVFFDYGQNSLRAEKKSILLVSKKLRAKFIEVKLDFYKNIINAKDKYHKKMKEKIVSIKNLKNSSGLSKDWYFPSRNIIFVTYALAIAEKAHVKENKRSDIFIGLKCEGNDSFPDATSAFVESMNILSKNSVKGHFNIKAPFIKKDKEDIILLGKELGVNLADTFSCYTSGAMHCGHCLACRLRQEGFYWANLKDNTRYISLPKDFRTA